MSIMKHRTLNIAALVWYASYNLTGFEPAIFYSHSDSGDHAAAGCASNVCLISDWSVHSTCVVAGGKQQENHFWYFVVGEKKQV
jgi:hypothetical protein